MESSLYQPHHLCLTIKTFLLKIFLIVEYAVSLSSLSVHNLRNPSIVVDNEVEFFVCETPIFYKKYYMNLCI